MAADSTAHARQADRTLPGVLPNGVPLECVSSRRGYRVHASPGFVSAGIQPHRCAARSRTASRRPGFRAPRLRQRPSGNSLDIERPCRLMDRVKPRSPKPCLTNHPLRLKQVTDRLPGIKKHWLRPAAMPAESTRETDFLRIAPLCRLNAAARCRLSSEAHAGIPGAVCRRSETQGSAQSRPAVPVEMPRTIRSQKASSVVPMGPDSLPPEIR